MPFLKLVSLEISFPLTTIKTMKMISISICIGIDPCWYRDLIPLGIKWDIKSINNEQTNANPPFFTKLKEKANASDNAAIRAKFSVPALNPNSWFPPKIVDSIKSSFLTKSTPTPFGPQTLCEAKKNA